MKYYEVTCTILPDFSEENLIAQLPSQPIKKLLTSSLISVEFWTEPDKIEELEKKLKANPQIQRCLIVVKKPEKLRLKPVRKPIREFKAQAEKPKVELKEIEKKLDEILKD